MLLHVYLPYPVLISQQLHCAPLNREKRAKRLNVQPLAHSIYRPDNHRLKPTLRPADSKLCWTVIVAMPRIQLAACSMPYALPEGCARQLKFARGCAECCPCSVRIC